MTEALAGADPVVVPPGYEAEVFLDGLEVPNDLAFDPTGGLLVSETGASRVSRIEILADGSPGDVAVVASGIADAEGLALSDDGVLYVSNAGVVYRVADGVTAPFAGGFADAEGLAIDANGDLYVADDAYPGIRITRVEVLPDGTAGAITEVLIVPGGSAGDIDFGPTGDLFIANNDDAVWVVKFAADGTVISIETHATFPAQPFALAFDSSGTLFVGTTSGTIWSIEPGLAPTLFADELASVEGLTFDSAGALYLSNQGPNQIVRITRTAMPVAIDLKPGSYPNSLNINGHGAIPVAVLGSSDFDVTQIDMATLEFAGLEVKANKKGEVQCSFEDVSGDFTYLDGAPDGYLDLVCHFLDDLDRWSPDNGTATLTGSLLPEYGGTVFAGSDEYRLVPVGQVGSPGNPVKLILPHGGDVTAAGQILADALHGATGASFDVVEATGRRDVYDLMCESSQAGLGYINTLAYSLASVDCGVDTNLRFVRFRQDGFWTEFLVPRDSGLDEIADLHGLTWAHPAEDSISGYLVPLGMMVMAGVEPSASFEVEEGHDATVLAVYDGAWEFGTTAFLPPTTPEGVDPWVEGDPPDIPEELVPACAPTEAGLFCDGWEVEDFRSRVADEAPDVVQQVRILAISPKIPNDALAFGSQFPEDLRESIEAALVNLADPDGPQYEVWENSMKALYEQDSLAVVDDADWDWFREVLEAAEFSIDDL
jgi:phosphonate transport system substrate-binding protein